MSNTDTHEHLCLLRQWGGLQTRVSAQMQALACAEAEARARAEAAELRCAALQSTLVRERARWVLACTRWTWGLGRPPVVRPDDASAAVGASAPAYRAGSLVEAGPVDVGAPYTATDVLCQTACQGQAHPWLKSGGGCRLTGGDCTRVRSAAALADGDGDEGKPH